MSYELAGIVWNDDGSLAFPGKILTMTEVMQNHITTICINDSVEHLHVQYKGKEYKFNLEKVLNVLADVVEDQEAAEIKKEEQQ